LKLSKDGFGNKRTGTSRMKRGKNISMKTAARKCAIGDKSYDIMKRSWKEWG
jgi:hypothetical protein